MDNQFLEFLYYIISSAHENKNSFIILLFLIIGVYFSVKIIWKTGPSLLKFTGYLVGALFIILIISALITSYSI